MDKNNENLSNIIPRLGSFLIDYFIVNIIEGIILMLLYFVEIMKILSDFRTLNLEFILSLYIFLFSASLIAIIISCLYYPLSIIMFGNTFGRKLFSIKMVRYDDQELSAVNIYFREIGKIMLLRLTFGLEALFYFYKGENLTLHDRIFKTKFVSTKVTV